MQRLLQTRIRRSRQLVAARRLPAIQSRFVGRKIRNLWSLRTTKQRDQLSIASRRKTSEWILNWHYPKALLKTWP
jgi:hypothetical protein